MRKPRMPDRGVLQTGLSICYHRQARARNHSQNEQAALKWPYLWRSNTLTQS